MGFRNNSYATVWETKAGKGNYTDARISTSKKNKQTDQYKTDFSGWVRLVGNAHTKAAQLSEKSRIKLGDCEVTNSYVKEKNVTYTNFAVFDFEDANSGQGGNNQSNNAARNNGNSNMRSDGSFMNIPDGIDEELPFN